MSGKTLYEVFKEEARTMEDAERFRKAHEWIATLPADQRSGAMKRASRSYSVPDSCIREDGCRVEGDDIVWPNGERYPTSRDFLRKRSRYLLAELEMIALLAYRTKLRIMATACESEFIETEARVTEIRMREAEAELVNRQFECEEAGIPVVRHAALAALW